MSIDREGGPTPEEMGISQQKYEIRKDELIRQEINDFKEIVKRNFDSESINAIDSALSLMIELHSDQENRPDGKPYISHPLEIANDVVEKFGVKDKNLVLAALLHDSVEDQSVKLFTKRLGREYGEISKEIEIKDPKALRSKYQTELSEIALREIGFLHGDKVKEVVGHLSNPDFDSLIDELKSKGIEKTKNQLYKEHVEEAIKNPEVCVIKYADFARNALALGNLPEGVKKDKLRKKYGQVIQGVFLPAFRSITEDHPLFEKREAIIQELEKAYNEQYLTETKTMKSPEMGMDVPEQKMLEQKQKMVTELGSLLHDEWRASRKREDGSFEPRVKKTKDKTWKATHGGAEEVDIANTSFAELPADWQGENRAAAEVAMDEVFRAVESGYTLDDSFIEQASAAVHNRWLERNRAWAPEEQKKPFGELVEEEKEKDRAQVRKAIEIFESSK